MVPVMAVWFCWLDLCRALALLVWSRVLVVHTTSRKVHTDTQPPFLMLISTYMVGSLLR